ncbi:HAD family hydrolase [Proteinivorax hydrogeniformans]|uniref:HAD family hydrolase n=1 Tax=Proteinivorax hydrogeniformans TaxID=1826727 RepID=A0AAU8HT75_9FIRM
MKKAVIFDLDGTLLDTIEDIADSMNLVLSEANLPTHPVDSYKHFVGNGMPKMVKRALPKQMRDRENIEKFTENMRQTFAKNWDNKTKLYPGIGKALTNLKEQGTKLAILSNKPHSFTLEAYDKYLDKWEFDVVQGWDPDKAPLKPDPKSLLAIADKLKVKQSEVAYVGDSDVDMVTAQNADVFGVGVSWGFRGAQELRENGADEVVDSPYEILKCLNR